MRDLTPQEFLAKLNHHLGIKSEFVEPRSVKPEFQFIQEINNLETINNLLEVALSKYKIDYQLISDMVDTYNNKENKLEKLGSSDSSNQPDMIKSQLLAEIITAKEKRDKLGEEISMLRNRKDEVRGLAKRRKTDSDRFFSSFKSQVMLYSIVKLGFGYETSTFIILSKNIKERFSLEGLEHLKSDTAVANACLGKRVGEEINYKVREEFDARATILECSLPSVEQMEQLISALESIPPLGKQDQVEPFHLHDLYGSNNSRLRKGG